MLFKKKSKKKIVKDKDKSKPALHSDTKKGILVVVFFALTLLSLLSLANIAGKFGLYFTKISKILFGLGFFLIPLVFVLAALAILYPRLNMAKNKKPSYKMVFLGLFVFLVSILGIFHVMAADSGTGSVEPLRGGGYLGYFVGYPLIKIFGFWASIVVLLSLLLISILVTFNVSVIPAKKEEDGILVAEEVKPEPEKVSMWQKIKNKVKPSGKAGAPAEAKRAESKTSDSILGGRAEMQGAKASGATATLAKAKFVNKPGGKFKLPPLDSLEKDKGQPTSGDIKANINIIKKTLENFGIEVEMAEVNVGPSVTQYTLRPAQGIKLAKITALQNDMALALAAHPLRIEAPIPGRSLVGIEIPNRTAVMVRLRSLLERPTFQDSLGTLTFALGRDVAGNPMFANLTKMPHMLVAGATGTGKTIALNNLIVSLLCGSTPDQLRLILIDPKRVELTAYEDIPHLLSPVIVQADKAIGALRWAVSEMERRFEVLQEAGVRDVESYGVHVSKKGDSERLPYIVIVIDELADLMSSNGREVEAAIVRLAQMARAVGIHLVVSTQRPSVEVITGLIKANITSRMAFQVASQIDSRTILDMAGAEKLLGNGDMLFLAGNSAKPRRVQGSYISEKEIRSITDYLKNMAQPDYKDEVGSERTTLAASATMNAALGHDAAGVDDEMYEEAKQVVVQAGKASASLLQRRLRVGYARAARLLDILEENGVVGPADGAKPRDVYVDEGAEREV